MIYRKWSLLTGPVTALAGICGTIVAAQLIFFDNDWLRNKGQKKQDLTPKTN